MIESSDILLSLDTDRQMLRHLTLSHPVICDPSTPSERVVGERGIIFIIDDYKA